MDLFSIKSLRVACLTKKRVRGLTAFFVLLIACGLAYRFVPREEEVGSAAQAIIKSLENEPKSWRANEFYLWFGSKDDLDASVSIWIANGLISLEIWEPETVELSYFDQYYIWKAYKKWKSQHWVSADKKLVRSLEQ